MISSTLKHNSTIQLYLIPPSFVLYRFVYHVFPPTQHNTPLSDRVVQLALFDSKLSDNSRNMMATHAGKTINWWRWLCLPYNLEHAIFGRPPYRLMPCRTRDKRGPFKACWVGNTRDREEVLRNYWWCFIRNPLIHTWYWC